MLCLWTLSTVAGVGMGKGKVPGSIPCHRKKKKGKNITYENLDFFFLIIRNYCSSMVFVDYEN